MPKILVTGDFLVDHHIYQGRRHHFGDQGTRGVCVTEELGGSALIHRLLKELQACTHGNWESVLAVNETQELEKMRQCNIQAGCVDLPFAAYAFWRPCTRHGKDKDVLHWRVGESMGFGGGSATSGEWPWATA